MGRQGFTEKQKEWVRRRDVEMSGGCALCGRNPEETLHVHHVSPYRYSTMFLGWSVGRTNLPTNAIALCRECHNGYKTREREGAVHPDTERSRRLYAEDRNSYVKMEQRRDALAREGKFYWNPTHDEEMAKIAVRNSFRYVFKYGKEDPPPWDFD